MTQGIGVEDLLHFNGIDGDSGEYDLPPMTVGQLAELVRGERAPENLNELRRRALLKDIDFWMF